MIKDRCRCGKHKRKDTRRCRGCQRALPLVRNFSPHVRVVWLPPRELKVGEPSELEARYE